MQTSWSVVPDIQYHFVDLDDPDFGLYCSVMDHTELLSLLEQFVVWCWSCTTQLCSWHLPILTNINVRAANAWLIQNSEYLLNVSPCIHLHVFSCDQQLCSLVGPQNLLTRTRLQLMLIRACLLYLYSYCIIISSPWSASLDHQLYLEEGILIHISPPKLSSSFSLSFPGSFPVYIEGLRLAVIWPSVTLPVKIGYANKNVFDGQVNMSCKLFTISLQLSSEVAAFCW